MQASEPPSERRPLLTSDDDGYDSADDSTIVVRMGNTGGPSAGWPVATPPDSPISASLPPRVTASWLQRNLWVALALGSGACAAFNAVFAKLTTTSSTTLLAERLAALLGLAPTGEPAVAVEVGLRGVFFALNLLFDAVMWTIFTQALARAASATQVTVLNTSTNFLLTGLLGLAVFAEALPPQWWVGAVLLVAGNFVVGRASEGDERKRKAALAEAEAEAADAQEEASSSAAAADADAAAIAAKDAEAAAQADADADADVAALGPPDDSIQLVERVVAVPATEDPALASATSGRRSARLAARSGNRRVAARVRADE